MTKAGRPKKDEIRGYKGNDLIKRSGVAIEWDEEKLNEIAKCANDPIYFIEKYIKIVNLDSGLTEFKLRDYQEEIIKTFQEERLVCLLIGRQSGKCQIDKETVTIKNKKTGIIETIPVGDLYKRVK